MMYLTKLPFTDADREFTYFRMEDFYNFCKRNNWELDKTKTGNLLKQLDVFVEESRVRVKETTTKAYKNKSTKTNRSKHITNKI